MRVLVYVNTNPSQKHITIHCEITNSCPHVFQQLISQNTSMTTTIRSWNNKRVIKIAETSNSFWLLIWIDANSCINCQNLINDPFIQNIAKQYQISPQKISVHC